MPPAEPNINENADAALGRLESLVMPEFEREYRYLVMKFTDVNEHLSDEEKEMLLALAKKIAAGRADAGKMPLECVVVESDWPEYEPTWAAIEARMKA